MSTESESAPVIQTLRKGDLIGQHQQSDYRVYEVFQIVGDQILAICPTSWTMRSITTQEITPPF